MAAHSTRPSERRAATAFAVAALLAGGAGAAEPRFVERAAAQGIVHVYDGGWEHFVGGGVAVFDCNADRYPELFVAGGSNPAALLVNHTAAPGAELRYADETPDELRIAGVTGAYPLDFDNDGVLDLAVLRVGANLLLKGEPGCRFRDAAETSGFQGGGRWTTAFSATWEPGHRLPTLAFGNYVDRDNPDGPFGACDVNELHRPSDGRYGAPLVLAPGFCPLSMLFTDWARRGRQDLRVSNDRHYFVKDGREQLWRLAPVPHALGAEDGWQDVSIWGMGIASRDMNADGLLDVYLTSMGDQLLQFRDPVAPGPVWRDAPYAIGATATTPYAGDDGRPSTGWHAQFGDADNDGRDDILVVKGNVDQMPENASFDPNNLLMQQPDGSFREAGGRAGIGTPFRGRGGAFTDLNLDGRLDIVVVNRRAPMEIYQNVTEDTGNWLAIAVEQSGINTRLVGGWIELRGSGGWRAFREITLGGGHASGQAGFEHFGLGDLEVVDLRVVAPDGEASPWQRVPPNGFLSVFRSNETPPVPVRVEELPLE
jgi:enediyne biosynthesis protein E4